MEDNYQSTALFTQFFEAMSLPVFSLPEIDSQLYFLFKTRPEMFAESFNQLKNFIENDPNFSEETPRLLPYFNQTIPFVQRLVEEYIDLKSQEKNFSEFTTSAFKNKVNSEETKNSNLDRDDLIKKIQDAENGIQVKLANTANQLRTLTRNSLGELKSFAKPPQLVKICLECVCMMLGEKIDFQNAKKLINNPNFLSSLVNFNKDAVTEATINRIKKVIRADSNITFSCMEKVSSASASLFAWVTGIIDYHNYKKVIRELKSQLQNIEESKISDDSGEDSLANAQAKLEKLQLDQAIGPIIERQYSIENSVKDSIRVLVEKFFTV